MTAVSLETGHRVRAGRGPGSPAALALYAAASLVLFGAHVVGHLGSRIVASDAIDSSQFMWFFAWWPHALLHGLNPFVTHVMFVPQGFNLTWATAMPGPSVLLAPVTLAFGPAVTWNVIQLASPALSAWTAFLLCRHITGQRWPALAGGYMFGFSPYMLIHLTGGPYLALVALAPVMVLLVLRRVEGSLGSRAFVIWMALALTGQYLISSEVLATATVFGAVALVLAWLLAPGERAAIVRTAALTGLAYVVTAVLISPFLYYFVFGHRYPPGGVHFPADLSSLAIPSALMAITRHRPPLAGSNTEGYLGAPLIAIVVAFAWRGRRQRVTWLLVGSLLAAAICALGSHLILRGHRTGIPLPWLVLGKLPVLRYAIPVRLALFVALPAAVIVAMFLAPEAAVGNPGAAVGNPGAAAVGNPGAAGERRGWWRWGLALLAIVVILPDVGNGAWDTPIKDPAFFATGTYRSYLHPADHVLTIPAWGPNERWQADTGFRFKLADGYAGNPFPASYTRFATWNTLLTGHLGADYAAQLRRYVHAKGVTAIVVDETVPGPWRRLFGSLGVAPRSIGGVLLYRLSGPVRPA